MKKKWYDYLWILSLTYLILGFFNILFAWLGLLCFFHPTDHLGASGDQGILQPLLRPGAAIRFVGGALRPLPEAGHPRMDEEPGLPVWISGVLLRHVFPDALEHLAGVRGGAGPAAGGHAAVDLQAALALGLPWNSVPSGGSAVCLRLLQRDAHLHSAGSGHYGSVQAPQLVRLLPHGDHDAADLPGQTSNFITHHFRYMSKIILDIYQKLFYTGLNQSGTAQKRR